MRGKKTNIEFAPKSKKVDRVKELKVSPFTPQKKIPMKGLVRLSCVALIITEAFSYFRTADLRYGFQGLEPEYFNFTNVGNILSLLIHSFIIFRVVQYLKNKEVLNKQEVVITFILSTCVLLFTYILPPTQTDAIYWQASQELPYLYTIYVLIKIFELTVFGLISKSKTVIPFLKIIKRYLAQLLAIFLFIFCFVYFKKESVLEKRYDAAVVFGAAVWSNSQPSPIFKNRIITASQLLKKGTVGVLVLTGGNAPFEQAESEVAYNLLIEMNIDQERIIKEAITRSTISQVMFVRDSILKKGYSRIVFVSDDFHLFRLSQMAEFNGLKVAYVKSGLKLKWHNQLYYYLRETLAVVLYWFFGV